MHMYISQSRIARSSSLYVLFCSPIYIHMDNITYLVWLFLHFRYEIHLYTKILVTYHITQLKFYHITLHQLHRILILLTSFQDFGSRVVWCSDQALCTSGRINIGLGKAIVDEDNVPLSIQHHIVRFDISVCNEIETLSIN